MKILIACEYSGVVREAFRAKGHDAVSCDLLPTERVGLHYQCNVLDLLGMGWDMLIAFPPCTHLCVSGARYWAEKQKDGRQASAIKFFLSLWESGIGKICIENPVGIMSTRWRKPDQYIQPWKFGEDASKKTGLWLRGLPLLQPTKIIRKALYSNQTPTGQNKLSSSRSKLRGKTYPGVADAMAEQWG